MRVLVAGIGNIFLGDDGFGCEVVAELQKGPLPREVDAVDFGIRGMDLCYALTAGYDGAILVDTTERGEAPGTVYVIEPDFAEFEPATGDLDPSLVALHEMDPARVLRLVASLGERRPRTRLVACEPQFLGGEDGHMGLTDAVQAAVPRAIADIREILDEWLAGGRQGDLGATAAAH